MHELDHFFAIDFLPHTFSHTFSYWQDINSNTLDQFDITFFRLLFLLSKSIGKNTSRHLKFHRSVRFIASESANVRGTPRSPMPKMETHWIPFFTLLCPTETGLLSAVDRVDLAKIIASAPFLWHEGLYEDKNGVVCAKRCRTREE